MGVRRTPSRVPSNHQPKTRRILPHSPSGPIDIQDDLTGCTLPALDPSDGGLCTSPEGSPMLVLRQGNASERESIPTRTVPRFRGSPLRCQSRVAMEC